MKVVIIGLFMMLVLSNFVFAVGSEVSMDFVVNTHKMEVPNYVSDRSFVENYLWYIVSFFLALVSIYFIFINKNSSKKKTSKKKSSKKKSSKKKSSKKKVSKGVKHSR